MPYFFYVTTMEHPKVCKYKQCLGFSKDHRRCRLERNDEKTCYIHRNYYTNWFQRKETHCPELLTPRKKKEIIFQFNHIDEVERYIKGLNISYTNIKWFNFLIENTQINPLWNIPLLRQVIFTKIMAQKDIKCILATPDLCMFTFKYLIEIISSSIDNPTIKDQDHVDLWNTYLLEHVEWKCMMYSTFFMDYYNEVLSIARKNKKQNLVNNLEGVVLPAILSFKGQYKSEQKYGLIFKEELMMDRWHPSRLEEWYTLGGTELCDMMMGTETIGIMMR